MSDEARTATKAKEERKEPTVLERGQVGASPVSGIFIVLIVAHLILESILLLYSFWVFWEFPTLAQETATNPEPVTWLFWTFSISNERRLIITVAMAGALGSLIHALESLGWYVGNRKLIWSWVPRYIIMPIVGSVLGPIFYLVIRGGFFSPQATAELTSPFAFVALAGLVGMFSDQAILKLRGIAGSVFTKEELLPGSDALPRRTQRESEEEDRFWHEEQ